jgi:hypothetical protein
MLSLMNIGCESNAQEAGMTRASPQMRLLAKQLHSFEGSSDASVGTDRASTFPAVEKLRLSLIQLMGSIGCRALIARANKLAAAEIHWLAGLRIGEDGELHGVPEALKAESPTSLPDGEVALIAQLIGLLVAFIGPVLTLRLIKQVWPQLDFDSADFSKAPTHEKD